MPGPLIAEVTADLEEELMPTKTYRLDQETKRITGFIDGKEAITQSIHKLLSTERASYAVYGTEEGLDYGVELDRFIGRPFSFVKADIERTITDALQVDERILAVTDFVIGDPKGDTLAVSFTVATLYGDVEIKEEAKIK